MHSVIERTKQEAEAVRAAAAVVAESETIADELRTIKPTDRHYVIAKDQLAHVDSARKLAQAEADEARAQLAKARTAARRVIVTERQAGRARLVKRVDAIVADLSAAAGELDAYDRDTDRLLDGGVVEPSGTGAIVAILAEWRRHMRAIGLL